MHWHWYYVPLAVWIVIGSYYHISATWINFKARKLELKIDQMILARKEGKL